MKVLVIGQGGREHALAKALKLSPEVNEVHAVPGNDGMVREVICHPVSTSDHEAVVALCQKIPIDFVVIGPEAELQGGLSDALRSAGIDVFGPSQNAAQLESSKIFAKEFMERAHVPTGDYRIVSSVKECLDAAQSFTQAPYVLKADGLAGGKGVLICRDSVELEMAAREMFENNSFGTAGARALLEDFQKGWELSLHVVTNGTDFVTLPICQDHKRLLEKDEGPNTGGMGTVAPLSLDPQLMEQLKDQVIVPTLKQLQKEQLLYRGVIFFGIMVTPNGPKVIEYNVRFGDPETQVMMPLLKGSWAELFYSVAKGQVPQVDWKPIHSACVVLAAANYPQKPIKGTLFDGDPFAETASSYFLHAGTKKSDTGWVTGGGRVLNAVAIGNSLEEAIENAYEQSNYVKWDGMQMRRDIGQKVLRQNA